MNLKKIIIIGFFLLVVIFTVVIFKIFMADSLAFHQTDIKAEVLETYKVRGRPTQLSAKLSNNFVMPVPEEFKKFIQAGDSIIKESNSDQIILKSKSLNRTFTTTK
jgi:hypothetical protein